MPTKDSLGDRMKKYYEDAFRHMLPRRMPVVLRVDGKAFHTYTRGLKKPYSTELMNAMDVVALRLCESIQGAKLAYVQSDEVSVLIRNDDTFQTDAWLSGNIQKMASVAASIAAVTMTLESTTVFGKIKPAYFDARLFVVPENDVVNYFLWRQQDATRNAVQMLGQANFPHKELQGKSNKELQELLFQKKKINFDKEPTGFKRGRCIIRVPTEVQTRVGNITKNVWSIDSEIPIFSQDREYVGNRTKMVDQEETTEK